MTSRFLLGLAASLLLLASGCKEASSSSGGTTGAALYAFDGTGTQLLVWTDLSAVYDSATTPAPTRTLTSSLFSKTANLAWGGLCFDNQRDILYLVSETGDIVRVKRVRSQTGAISTTDVDSFLLDSGSRLSNGKFGQAALDFSNDTLYVTENGDNGTRIWVVANASNQLQNATVPLQAIKVDNDTGGTGVAAAQGVVYAFMKDGGTVGIDQLIGPRLRKGNSGGFDTSKVILGHLTTLGIYGALAIDTANGYLYVARHNTDAVSTAPPVMVFGTGQFGLAYDQAPNKSLGDATGQADLRVLSHPGNKDWLVGLRGQGTVAYPTIYLWKSPLGGAAAKTVTVATPAGAVFKGVAVDGLAS